MLSIILSVLRKSRPVRVQAALVISYYRSVVIEGTAPGVGRGKELLLSAEDGVHPNPVARGLAQRVRNRYTCSSETRFIFNNNSEGSAPFTNYGRHVN